MVKDRLKEFQELRKKAKLPLEEPHQAIQIEGNELALLQLLEKIGPLYSRVKELNTNAVDLRKGLNDPSKREKLSERIADVKSEARSLFKAIQEINLAAESDSHLLGHVARVHHLSLFQFFSTADSELSGLQEELHQRHKKYVEKELKVTGQEVNEDELENLLDRPALIFSQDYLLETQVAKQQLFDIQKRHDEVVKIEKSIVEVNQLFIELAALVKQQGEVVDRVENYVYEAQEKTSQAKVELREAQVYQTKARKKKLIIAGIVLAVLLIIILIIVLNLS